MMTTETRVRQVLGAVLSTDLSGVDVSRETVDLWDSIKHVEIIFALEDEFAVEFSEEEMAELSTLAAIVQAIEAKHAA